ncbi:MAG: nuclear transport factor 2 family protein [Sedimenticola sp.]
MSLVDRFNSFATAFEECVASDDWGDLGKYFTENATYWNVGGPDPVVKGRSAIVEYLKNDVSNNDRRFESRRLQAVSEPSVTGNSLTRRWRCTYTLTGTPDLVVEGEARYEFNGELISSLEEEITQESMEGYVEWMQKYNARLHT